MQQTIDPFVGRQAADEQHATPHLVRIGRVPHRIGAAVNHARAGRRRRELLRRIRRDGQEGVEQTWQQTTPVIPLQPVVGNRQALVSSTPDQRSHLARQAAHMMRVHDVRTGFDLDQSLQQTWRKGMRGMASQPPQGGQRPHPQTSGLAFDASVAAERDQFALDLACQSASQFEWVALATAE